MSDVRHIAGVDEAGRGPLAGPVVAAAVILDPRVVIAGLDDSKKLSEKRRSDLEQVIKMTALSWFVARASVSEIDEINILQATMLAMSRAVQGLGCKPDYVRVDGNRYPDIEPAGEAVVRGDSLHPEISAASILAKQERDRELVSLAEQLPQYGFEKHKGYPTADHIAAIRTHGVTEHHRQSFGPVREVIQNGVSK